MSFDFFGPAVMPFPNHDYGKRDGLLPSGCKDLADAIKIEEAFALPLSPEPPIIRKILLPEKVAVRYLAEVSGASLYTIIITLRELHVIIDVERSVDFNIAAKLLRKYGIAAMRSS